MLYIYLSFYTCTYMLFAYIVFLNNPTIKNHSDCDLKLVHTLQTGGPR